MNRKLVALFLSCIMSMSTAIVYAEPTNEETFQKENVWNVQEDEQKGLVFEKNNIKSFRELKKLKWNQIIGMINEVNDIDDETKKLYSETIKDLIWLNNKKVS